MDWQPQPRRQADGLATRASTRTDTGAEHARPRDRLRHRSARRATTAYHRSSGPGPAACRPTAVNALRASVQQLPQRDRSRRAGPQLTFPSIQDGTSLPRAAGHRPGALPDRRHASRGARQRTRSAPAASAAHRRGKFDLGVFREGRVELVQDFPSFDPNGDGRVDDKDLLFAVTLRSGKPDQTSCIRDCRQQPRRGVRPGRLAPPRRPDAQPRPALRSRHRRQEREPGTARSTRSCSRSCRATAQARPQQLGPARRLQLGAPGRPDERARRLRHLLRPRDAARSSRSSAASTAARCRSRCAPATCSSSTRPPGSSRRSPRRTANPFTGFILPGAGASGINIIDNGLQNPTVQQFNLGVQRELGRGVGRARRRPAQPRDAFHHRPHGRQVFNPVVGGPDRVVNLESSVNTKYDALLVSAERRGVTVRRCAPPTRCREGVQLRERRPDPVRQRPDRPERPVARVRPDAERPAAPLHGGCLGRGACLGLQLSPDLDGGLRRCRWTS